MEYLEGETLAARLARKAGSKDPALPMEEALRYAIEMADALDRAHRHGIIHRDLKPGNVMLTKDGAKLLDFGLAKLRPGAGLQAGAGVSAQPTEAPLTGQGAILGTLQYMAPEQLEGKEADARVDIFAFGAVVYEMVTGRKAFEGSSPASVIAAILDREPPAVSSFQTIATPLLDHVVKRCLAKNAEERWQSAGDMMRELKWVAEGGAIAIRPATSAASSRRQRIWQIVAGVLVLTAAALALPYFSSRPAEPSLIRLSLEVPGDINLQPDPRWPQSRGALGGLAIAPDGQRVVFLATREGRSRLWLRSLDSAALQPLPGTEGGYGPFWSPDGRSIGFFAEGKLKRLDLGGGYPQTLCESVGARGGAWSRNGVILFAGSELQGLSRVAAAGGAVTSATTLDRDRQENSHRWPYFLPDGRHFVYAVRSNLPENHGIHLGSLDSPERRRLAVGFSTVEYSPPGYLLFVRDGVLFAQPFDEKRLEVVGDAARLAGSVEFNAGTGGAVYSVSETGVLIYAEPREAAPQLAWLDHDGRLLVVQSLFAGRSVDFRLAPDGRRLVHTRVDPVAASTDLWITDVARGTSERLTPDPRWDQWPLWSPDGRTILFKGANGLYAKGAGGGSVEKLVLTLPTGGETRLEDWSRDGQLVIYSQEALEAKRDLFILSMTGDRKPAAFLRTPFNEQSARLSPDGRFVAYVSDESGTDQVYVTRFPQPTDRWHVSTAGGALPQWSPDGRTLYYLTPDGSMMMAVERDAQGGFGNAATRSLFTAPGRILGYAVSGDGKRFLASIASGSERGLPGFTVMLNWTAALRR